MATNPAVPYWDEANTITCRGTEAITGKRVVHIAGPRIDGNPAVEHRAGADGSKPFGVSARDAAQGEQVSVYTSPGLVMPVVAAVAISADDLVYSTADGRVTNVAAGPAVGTALDDAAQGADVPVKLA